MKKASMLSVLLVAMASLLTACNGGSPKVGIKGDVLLYDREAYLSTYKGLRTVGMGYATENFTSIKTEKGRYDCITDVKALVVGVDFTDFTASSLPKGEEGTLVDLDKAIFGATEDTGWESLKSYYYKTSYGICNIEGSVVPAWYHTNVTVTDFAAGKATNGASGESATQALAKLVSTWAVENHNIDLKDYDANKDGFVDSVIMIYSCEPHIKVNNKAVNDDLFWAFCWSRNVSSTAGDVENPEIYRFFWSSYYTFYEDGYYDEQGKHQDWTKKQIVDGDAKLDAHTLIHEFGHVLSMPDYYNGDYNSKDPAAYEASGALDMMAYNIGDHNAFSKALYGWVAPYLVYGEATVTLRSTTDFGDFIIIPFDTLDDPTRDFTLLSQFLVIEFLTPTGVAYSDSVDAYAGSFPVWYSVPGVRVNHIDARLGMFSRDGTFQGFTGSVSAPSGGYTSFACDNNKIDRSFNKNCKLLEIVPANGTEARYLLGGRANNDCLYQKGAQFNTGSESAVWNDFCGHDNAGGKTRALHYGFTITNMTADTCTIKIVKR